MHALLLAVALLTLIAIVAGAVDVARGDRTVRLLGDAAPLREGPLPRVSVVIAARDEQRNIEEALQSVLGQDYPALEVVVVNDRSTDGTGAVLERLAALHPRLRVIHVTELPPGWLGKNHALQRGAAEAVGEWLLFTDADVVMEPSAVARAVGYVEREKVDHLAIAPELRMPGALLDLFGGTFAILFAQYARPWRVSDPRSKRYVGVGAFNMVRTAAYRAIGGHQRIAMRPDDDIKLGKLLKGAGFRQHLLAGRGMIRVEWYSSLGEAIRGLEKNSFAALEYSVAAVLAATLVLLLVDVWPFVAVFVTGGWVRALNAGIAGVLLAVYAASTRASGSSPLLGLGFPVAVLLFIFIIWRSMLLTLIRDGIRWRGTHYPLDELRANRV